MGLKLNLCALGATALMAAQLNAATISIGASQDAMIFGTSANADTGNASGKGPALFAGADGSSNKKRSLLEFNVASAIPAGATITDVTLTLTIGQVAGSGGGSGGSGATITSRNYSLHDNLQQWGEGNSGSPTSTTLGGTGQGYARVNGDSTWDYAFYNSNPAQATTWAGGQHGGNFAPINSGTLTITNGAANSSYSFLSTTGLVADVQSWLDSPSTNFGWMLKSDTGITSTGATVDLESTPTSFLGFYSREGAISVTGSAANAPTLTITYTPEPTSLALVGLSGLVLLRRRK